MTDPAFIPEDYEEVGLAPHSALAEETVLGMLFINPDAYGDVAGIISNEDFFILRNGWVFEAMENIHGRGERIETGTVIEELKSQVRLDDIGGMARITELASGVGSAVDIESYARIIERASIRRGMLESSVVLSDAALQEDIPIIEAIDKFDVSYAPVMQRLHSADTGGLQPIAGLITGDFDDWEAAYKAYKASRENRYKFGLVDLDKLVNTSGGKYITIAGRPGTGKSTMLQTIVYNSHIAPFISSEAISRDHVALPNKTFMVYPYPDEVAALPRIAFFSAEMGADELGARWIAMISGISAKKQEDGDLTFEEFTLCEQIKAMLESLGDRILIQDNAFTIQSITTECMAMQPEAVFIDYVQLINSTAKHSNDLERLVTVTRQHKALARALGRPVFSGAQINRDGDKEGKVPTLSHLKGSSTIEEDSDVVIALHKQEIESPHGQTDAYVLKQRNGPTGDITLLFDRNRTMFRNYRE